MEATLTQIGADLSELLSNAHIVAGIGLASTMATNLIRNVFMVISPSLLKNYPILTALSVTSGVSWVASQEIAGEVLALDTASDFVLHALLAFIIATFTYRGIKKAVQSRTST